MQKAKIHRVVYLISHLKLLCSNNSCCLDSDDLVVNGSKMWITNGAEADWICLLATTNDGPPHRNKSLICVPMDTPGITVARRIDKLG